MYARLQKDIDSTRLPQITLPDSGNVSVPQLPVALPPAPAEQIHKNGPHVVQSQVCHYSGSSARVCSVARECQS